MLSATTKSFSNNDFCFLEPDLYGTEGELLALGIYGLILSITRSWYALVDDFRTLAAGLLILQVANLGSIWSP